MKSLLKIAIVLLLLLAFAVPVAASDASTAAPDAAVASAESETLSAEPSTALPSTAGLVATGTSADGLVTPEADALSGASTVIQLFRAGEWKLAIAALLMVLLGLTKNLWSFIPKDWKPHFVAASTGVGSFATAVLAGMPVMEALWAAMTVSAFTQWLYSLAKVVLKKIPGLNKIVDGMGGNGGNTESS